MPEGFIRSIKNNKISGPTIVDSTGKQLATIPKEFVPNLEISHIKKACIFERDEKNIVTKLSIEGKEIQKDNSIVEQKEIEQNKIKEKELANQKGKEDADRLEREQQRNTRNNPAIPTPNFSIENLLLPKDTKGLINVTSIDNYALRLFKSGVFEKKKEEYKFEVKHHANPNFNSVNCKGIAERQLQSINLLSLKDMKSFKLATDWRMALGLGNESVYETSITLHHIYGIPYIPASAIKGITRSWIITHCFADANVPEHPLRYAEGYAIKNKLFCDLFGCSEKIKLGNRKDDTERTFESYYQENENDIGGTRQGKIIFFDAFPTTIPQVNTDIMNPHYGEYYSSEGINIKPPGDYYNPIPIPFLTVENTIFQFIIGTKKNEIIEKSEELQRLIYIDGKKENPFFSEEDITKTLNQKKSLEELTLLDLTFLWLHLALTEHGIGAKTAVGYGYMK